MPELPPGEADLRALSERFSEAEQRIRAPIGQAPEGDRSNLLREALLGLVVLRRRNFKDPVVRAYLHEHTGAAQTPFVTLPGPLAERLDRGLQAASEGHQERPSGGCPGALPQQNREQWPRWAGARPAPSTSQGELTLNWRSTVWPVGPARRRGDVGDESATAHHPGQLRRWRDIKTKMSPKSLRFPKYCACDRSGQGSDRRLDSQGIWLVIRSTRG